MAAKPNTRKARPAGAAERAAKNDSKTYQLGNTGELGPFDDGLKRHVSSTTVRVVNPSGRGEAL